MKVDAELSADGHARMLAKARPLDIDAVFQNMKPIRMNDFFTISVKPCLHGAGEEAICTSAGRMRRNSKNKLTG